MNLLIFLDLSYNPCKISNFTLFKGKITNCPGGTYIPGLHWESPRPPGSLTKHVNFLIHSSPEVEVR